MSIQGTDQWKAERCGRLTASRLADALAKIKTGWGASRDNYAAELVAERLTGVPYESYTSPAMQWGKDTEALARRAYAFHEDAEIQEAGFVPHPTIAMSGASPDGLVGDDGLVEIKAPLTATHIKTLRGASIDGKYLTQMMWQMACTGRLWCDWVSFDPRLPEEMNYFCKRVTRDDALIAKLETDAKVFLSEVDALVAELSRIYLRREAA